MRKLPLILAILSLCSVGEGRRWIPPQSAGGGGGCSFILNEGFEGTGAPTGWGGGGGGNFDSTTSPLVGAQSLRCVDGTSVTTPDDSESEVYIKFAIRVSALPADHATLVNVRKADGSNIVHMELRSTGVLRVTDFGSSADTVSTLSGATIYDIEIHCKAGSGSNGVVSVGFVAHGGSIPISGNAFAGFTNSSITDNSLKYDLFGDSVTTDYDTFQTCTSFIP